jgi:hypothetical protein
MGTTIGFYTGTLGFTLEGLWPEKDPEWCMLSCDGVRIIFRKNAHLGPPQMTGTLYIETTAVLSLHRQLANQVEVLWGPEVYHYGMLEFAIKDCNRYMLSFGQPTEFDATGK